MLGIFLNCFGTRFHEIELKYERRLAVVSISKQTLFVFIIFQFQPISNNAVDDTFDFRYVKETLSGFHFLSLVLSSLFYCHRRGECFRLFELRLVETLECRDLCYFQDWLNLMLDREAKHSCDSRVWNLIKYPIKQQQRTERSPFEKCCVRIEKHVKLGIKAGWKTLDDVSFHTLNSPSCLSEIDVHKFS